jgi:hypothetical protein
MCGIYGRLSSHQIDASIAETAMDRLVHCGAHDSGGQGDPETGEAFEVRGYSDREVVLAQIEQSDFEQASIRCVGMLASALCWMKRGYLPRPFFTRRRLVNHWREHRSVRADWVSSLWSMLKLQACARSEPMGPLGHAR